jgi:hypothetical protein
MPDPDAAPEHRPRQLDVTPPRSTLDERLLPRGR